jgi:hypothetical protein
MRRAKDHVNRVLNANHSTGGTEAMNSRPAPAPELRASLHRMMDADRKQHDLAWVIMALLDNGNISEIKTNDQPEYVVTGIASLEGVAHLIATVEDPIYAALLELVALGSLSFRPDKANLMFKALGCAN